MKIAKEYKWEMGHRLTFVDGKCKNLHGHTYKMRIELDGEPDKYGMVLDYFIIDDMVKPILDKLDHGVTVYIEDKDLIEFLTKMNFRHTILDQECTAENITFYLLNQFKQTNLPNNVKSIKIRVYETEDAYAEESLIL